MSRGETGYRSLLNLGLVPSIPGAVIDHWSEVIEWLDDLVEDQQGISTLVLDALDGFEFLAHEYVVNTSFEGNWGKADKTGFAAYGKGYDAAVPELERMTNRLEKIHERGVAIVILGHVRIRNHTDPLYGQYDRYETDVHWKSWGVFHRWADHVLFGAFTTTTRGGHDDKRKETGRSLFTSKRDAYDAKHKGHDIPHEIEIPDDPEEMARIIQKYFW